MEWFNTAQSWFTEYWPIVVASFLAVVSAVGVAYGIYLQAKGMLQPVMDWIKSKKEEEPVTQAKENIKAKLEAITLETQITDLEEKLNNPVISEEGKAKYMNQLKVLYEVKAKMDAGTAVIEDTTSKY